MLTPADLAAIAARLGAATPGPWRLYPRDVSHGKEWPAWVLVADSEADGDPDGDRIVAECEPPDADLIAHAPADLAALLARVAELEAERDELAATLANERGEGDPPGEGWERNDFDAEHVGIAWYRGECRGQAEVPMDGATICWAYREPGEAEWTWEVEQYDALGDNYHHAAEGKAATAREAMRAADRAARGDE